MPDTDELLDTRLMFAAPFVAYALFAVNMWHFAGANILPFPPLLGWIASLAAVFAAFKIALWGLVYFRTRRIKTYKSRYRLSRVEVGVGTYGANALPNVLEFASLIALLATGVTSLMLIGLTFAGKLYVWLIPVLCVYAVWETRSLLRFNKKENSRV